MFQYIINCIYIPRFSDEKDLSMFGAKLTLLSSLCADEQQRKPCHNRSDNSRFNHIGECKQIWSCEHVAEDSCWQFQWTWAKNFLADSKCTSDLRDLCLGSTDCDISSGEFEVSFALNYTEIIVLPLINQPSWFISVFKQEYPLVLLHLSPHHLTWSICLPIIISRVAGVT